LEIQNTFKVFWKFKTLSKCFAKTFSWVLLEEMSTQDETNQKEMPPLRKTPVPKTVGLLRIRSQRQQTLDGMEVCLTA
jgi:hypothetical protein